MSSSALKIDDHLAWIAVYLECWNRVASLAYAGELPRVDHTSRLAAISINLSADIAAHVSAVVRALPPAVRQLQAPWESATERSGECADRVATLVARGERAARRMAPGGKL
jgi:hypothetical protein